MTVVEGKITAVNTTTRFQLVGRDFTTKKIRFSYFECNEEFPLVDLNILVRGVLPKL